jgi:mRNA-degrading endonuclease RelE of RelBE toxin-antitoxin system
LTLTKLRDYVNPTLRQNPYFGPNIKRLKNWKPPTWRYRVGEWRFFYEVDEMEKTIFLIAADHRKFERASRRAQERIATFPTALVARYDHRTRRVVIRLSSGLEVAFSPQDAQGLEHASPSQLDKIEITPSGFGIHFPKLDADLYLPALLEGFLGSKQWMASRLGAAGGESRTLAKTSASRRNGRLGGRPRKVAPAKPPQALG